MAEFPIDVGVLNEQAGDPAPLANAGKYYTKDSGGVTELFYESSNGTVYQLTPPSGSGAAITTAAEHWYISSAFGNDANDGMTPGTAFATLAKAFTESSKLLGAPLIFHLGNGSYSYPPIPPQWGQFSQDARIWLYGDGAGQGADTGFTVVTTGVAAAGTNAVRLRLAAPIATDLYQHLTLEYTTGVAAGGRVRIKNTLTTDIFYAGQFFNAAGAAVTPAAGDSFRIIRTAVTITMPGAGQVNNEYSSEGGSAGVSGIPTIFANVGLVGAAASGVIMSLASNTLCIGTDLNSVCAISGYVFSGLRHYSPGFPPMGMFGDIGLPSTTTNLWLDWGIGQPDYVKNLIGPVGGGIVVANGGALQGAGTFGQIISGDARTGTGNTPATVSAACVKLTNPYIARLLFQGGDIDIDAARIEHPTAPTLLSLSFGTNYRFSGSSALVLGASGSTAISLNSVMGTFGDPQITAPAGGLTYTGVSAVGCFIEVTGVLQIVGNAIVGTGFNLNNSYFKGGFLCFSGFLNATIVAVASTFELTGGGTVSGTNTGVAISLLSSRFIVNMATAAVAVFLPQITAIASDVEFLVGAVTLTGPGVGSGLAGISLTGGSFNARSFSTNSLTITGYNSGITAVSCPSMSILSATITLTGNGAGTNLSLTNSTCRIAQCTLTGALRVLSASGSKLTFGSALANVCNGASGWLVTDCEIEVVGPMTANFTGASGHTFNSSRLHTFSGSTWSVTGGGVAATAMLCSNCQISLGASFSILAIGGGIGWDATNCNITCAAGLTLGAGGAVTNAFIFKACTVDITGAISCTPNSTVLALEVVGGYFRCRTSLTFTGTTNAILFRAAARGSIELTAASVVSAAGPTMRVEDGSTVRAEGGALMDFNATAAEAIRVFGAQLWLAASPTAVDGSVPGTNDFLLNAGPAVGKATYAASFSSSLNAGAHIARST